MNKQLFKAEMIKHGDTQTTLADAMGIPQSALSARINGKTDFRENEIKFIRKRYNLTPDLTILIFFVDEVSDLDTTKGA